MTRIQNLITETVSLAGGRVVGRTRLQKIIYLLDQKGLNSGASFYYYNFGPFSDDVANGIVDEKFSGRLREKVEARLSDGSPYSVFETDGVAVDVQTIGELPADTASSLISQMTGVTSTVLELAATIHWLAFVERVDDWRSELFKRKGNKAEAGRSDKALQLLRDLNLADGLE